MEPKAMDLLTNLGLRSAASDRKLTVDDVLGFIRRAFGVEGWTEVADAMADHEVVVFVVNGNGAGPHWITVQSAWAGWDRLARNLAARAEKELGALAVITWLHGDTIVDIVPYQAGRPARRSESPLTEDESRAELDRLGMKFCLEVPDRANAGTIALRFRASGRRAGGIVTPMSQAGRLAIPRLFCGEAAAVKTAWRRVTRRVAREGTWQNVLPTLDFVDLEATKGYLARLEDGRTSMLGDIWYQYMANDTLWLDCMEAAGSRDHGSERVIALTMEGLDWFWVCLGLLGGNSIWFPNDFVKRPNGIAELKSVVRHVMPWWDTFCQLRPRFLEPSLISWMTWGSSILSACSRCGLPREEYDRICNLDNLGTPEAAGDAIRKWLQSSGS